MSKVRQLSSRVHVASTHSSETIEALHGCHVASKLGLALNVANIISPRGWWDVSPLPLLKAVNN